MWSIPGKRSTSPSSRWLLLTVVTAALGTGFAPGCASDETAAAEGYTEANGECMSNSRFFAEQVWARVMQQTCVNCHSPDGIAVQQGADFMLLPPTYPGFLEANLQTLEQLARTEYDDRSVLLRKPVGEMDHGGGVQLAADSVEATILDELVRRLQEGDPCPDAQALGSFDDVVLLDGAASLRKAALHLVSRLPTPEETQWVVDNGDDGLSSQLDAYMTEPAFFNRLKEAYNDLLMTDRYLGYNGYAVDQLNEEYWPNAADDYYDTYTDEEKARINRAVAREPLELISYVVRNDLPFTEILTAGYTVVNPFSAGIYNAAPSFVDPNDENEWQPAQIGYIDANGSMAPFPHAGVLTSPMFLNRFPSTPTNRNRHRARMVFKLFLATDILRIGERPLDPTASTRYANPTREDPSCASCHKLIDPVAGAFQKYSDYDQEKYEADREWHTEMFPPGFGREEMTLPDYDYAQSWLGTRLVADPRFVYSAVTTVYAALLGREPLLFPTDVDAADYGQRLAAWEAQDQLFRSIGEEFVAANYNLKVVFRRVLLSPYYRAANAVAPLSPERELELSELGTGRLSTPELLTRKIEATTGVRWKRGWDSNDWLTSDYRILFGGIDSDTVTQRLTAPNGIMANVAWRMANELACSATAWDISRPLEQRKLFPYVEATTFPSDAAGIAAVQQNIQYLHSRLLGENLELTDPELLRTYQLFLDTWNEGLAKLSTDEYADDLVWSCRGRWDPATGEELPEGERLEKDDQYIVRSWMAVVTYLLADYKFLYE
jgi:mono/diheme cytochrome c family protein